MTWSMRTFAGVVLVLAAMTAPGLATELTDAQVDNLVRRSYQFVAMYNVNNKFALKQGGWNTCVADTQLKDHTMREIARPNNDTLYISCLLDVRVMLSKMRSHTPASAARWRSPARSRQDMKATRPRSS